MIRISDHPCWRSETRQKQTGSKHSRPTLQFHVLSWGVYEGGGGGLYGGRIQSHLLNILMGDLSPRSAIYTFIHGLKNSGWHSFAEWQQTMANLPISPVSQDELQNRLYGYTTLLAKGISAEQKFLPSAFILDLASPFFDVPRLGGVHTAVNEVFAYSVGITGQQVTEVRSKEERKRCLIEEVRKCGNSLPVSQLCEPECILGALDIYKYRVYGVYCPQKVAKQISRLPQDCITRALNFSPNLNPEPNPESSLREPTPNPNPSPTPESSPQHAPKLHTNLHRKPNRDVHKNLNKCLETYVMGILDEQEFWDCMWDLCGIHEETPDGRPETGMWREAYRAAVRERALAIGES